MTTTEQITDWALLRSEPGRYSTPADIEGTDWLGAARCGAAAPVGALTGTTDTDAYDWWMRAEVRGPGRLTLSGLTAPGELYLDGLLVAEVESMFLPVSLELDGDHELILRFPSLRQWLRTRRPRGRWRSTLVPDQGLRWLRTSLIGRAPVYGAGALPAPVGVWRPARIRRGPVVEDLRLDTDPDSGTVRVRAEVSADAAIDLAITGPDGTVIAAFTDVSAHGRIDRLVSIPDPQVWWPRGYGGQPCYRLIVGSGDATLATRLFGFRRVSVDRSDGGFTLCVNDLRVFARGVTWVPPDPISLTVDVDTLHAQLNAFADVGAIMVRVVGGMVYEQTEFYELCAELGLLVWQDAMHTTFDPPPEIGDLICRELDVLLGELSGNPALAVISGGSETEQQPEMFGVDAARRDLPLLQRELPAVVAEYGALPYLTSSPSSPAPRLAIAPDVGVAHWFGVGGYLRPLADVQTAGVRFAAESLAFAIPPSGAAIDKHFAAAQAGHHPAWKAGVPRDRTASWDFEDVRDFYVRELFGVDPAAVRRVDPERYLQLGRVAIAEAMVTCFRYWRRDRRCGGALILSAKDLLPGAGWGLLDSDGGAKLPLAVLRRIWSPLAVAITDDGLSGLRIDVHNDRPEVLRGSLELVATDAMGHETVTGTADLAVPAHAVQEFRDDELTGRFTDLNHGYRFGPRGATAVDVRVIGADGALLAREAAVLDPARGRSGLRAVAVHTESGWVLEVSADSALRYVCITADGWRPVDDCFALAAGVSYRVPLECGTADASVPPRGSVGSVDAVESARIEVTGR